MGCAQTRENIEAEMLLLQLMRTEIQDERKAILKQLEEISGKKVIRPKIPDYLAKKKKTKTLSNNDEKSPRKPKKILKQKQRTKCDENDDSESNNEKERYVDNTISKIEEISFN